MSELVRFGISLDRKLLQKFDRLTQKEGYNNRSEAIRDLIRKNLIQKEWGEGKEIAGAIIMVYDHHKRDLVNRLTDIQHNYQSLIISTQHVHLDHDNCLEIIAIKGRSEKARDLLNALKSQKKVKHANLSMSSTGKFIE